MISQRVIDYLDIVKKWCKQTNLPIPFVLAIIQQESGGKYEATRFEKEYLKKYKDSQKFQTILMATKIEPEKIATSYGLMQLMVMTAWGYLSKEDRGPKVLEALLDPNKNIRYGCAHLSTLHKRNRGNLIGTAEDYNGTGFYAEKYAKNVMALAFEYEDYLMKAGLL